MEKLCCISGTLAARLIGAFDLSTSILAINFIAREFFTDEHGLLSVFDEIQILLGSSWANTSMISQRRLFNYKWILVCHMIYSTVHLTCSAALILGTIFRKKAYAMPWLTFEVISLANQASGIVVHIFQHQCSDGNLGLAGPAYVPMASLYFVLGAYFWLIVFAAQKSWPTETAEVFLELEKATLENSHVVDVNSEKTPSRFLSVDCSIFESPEPPISSKYYVL